MSYNLNAGLLPTLIGQTTPLTITSTGQIAIANSTASTNTTTGALTIVGGLGIAGALFGTSASLSTTLDVTGLATLNGGITSTAGARSFGASTFTGTISGTAATLSTTLGVTGLATLNGGITSTAGARSFGASTFTGTISGTAATLSTTLDVTGTTTLGVTNISNLLTVTNNIVLAADNRALVVDDLSNKRLGLVKKSGSPPFFAIANNVSYDFRVSTSTSIDNVVATTYNSLMTLSAAGQLNILNSIPSTSTTTGSLIIAGGLGVNGALFATSGNFGTLNLTNLNVSGLTTLGTTNPVTVTSSGLVTIPGLASNQAVFTDASDNLVSVGVTGTGLVVLQDTPTIITPFINGVGTPNTGTTIATFRNSANANRVWIIDETTTGSVPTGIATNGAFGLGLYNIATGPINFYTTAGNTLRMSIANNGNITLGTSTPMTISAAGAVNIASTLNVSGITTLGATTGATVSATGALVVNNTTDATAANAASLRSVGGIASQLAMWAGGIINTNSYFFSRDNTSIAFPAFTTRSIGTRLVLFPNISGSSADFALGIGSSSLWYGVPNTSSFHRFYHGDTETMAISGTNLNLPAFTSASTSATSGALRMVGGIGINNVTDVTALNNGGSFTSAGGMSVAKKFIAGTSVNVGALDTLNISKLFLSGPVENVANGPHYHAVVTSDVFPVFQNLNFNHNNIALNFDMYYDGAWKTTHASSNGYQIYKIFNELQFVYTSAQGQNVTATRNIGFKLDATGLLTANKGIFLSNAIESITAATRINSLGNMVNSLTEGNPITTDLKVINKRVKTSNYNGIRCSSSWYLRSGIDNSKIWTGITWSPELSVFCAVNNNGINPAVQFSSDGLTWSNAIATGIATWSSICWASELGRFIVVGTTLNGGGELAMRSTANTASGWEPASSLNTANSWTSVCWSSELRLAVAVSQTGTNNRVATTSDGLSWTTRTSAANNNWQSVCWSPELNLFVAVSISGTGNRVMTSPDGLAWTTRTSAADFAWYSVCWSPELYLFVAVGIDGSSASIMTSPNGINWTIRPTGIATLGWSAVTWNPDLSIFVAIGNSNQVLVSADGIVWIARSIPSNNNWASLIWSPELSIFCAVGQSGTSRALTSIPGLPNSRSTLLINPSHVNVNADDGAITAARSFTLSQSTGSIVANTRLTSAYTMVNSTSQGSPVVTDLKVINQRVRKSVNSGQKAAESWFSRTGLDNTKIWTSVCWSPLRSQFVAVNLNASPSIAYSSDGQTWATSATPSTATWSSICWAPEANRFLAVATSPNGGSTVAMYSNTNDPAGSWISATSLNVQGTWTSICWSSELQIAVAVASSVSIGTNNRVATSDSSGVTWTTRVSAADNAWNSVCWSPELLLFVAVASSGSGNRVMTSPDGITWTTRTSAADNDWRSVCWSPELYLFVAVASSGTNRVMTSPDGIAWTSRSASSANQWNTVCWAPGLSMFLALAEGGGGTGAWVMRSYDGINWSGSNASVNNAWEQVCWSPDLAIFFAVGSTGSVRGMGSLPSLAESRSAILIDYDNIDRTSTNKILLKEPLIQNPTFRPLSGSQIATFQNAAGVEKMSAIDFAGNRGGFSTTQASGLQFEVPDTGNHLFRVGTENVMQIANDAGGITIAAPVDIVGGNDLNVTGALTKGSGTFDIPHPIPEKEKQGYRLRHSFVESPNAGDNLYRYKVTTKDLKAEIDLPEYWKYLNENPQVFITAQDVFGFSKAIVTFTDGKGKVILDVTQDGTYNILVIGTRCDKLGKKGWDSKGLEYIDKNPKGFSI